MELKQNQSHPTHSPHEGIPPSGFWENHLGPFLGKYSLALCLCFVAIAGARIISTYNALSLTADEATHFACGLEYLAKHVYRLEVEHPPLPRAMEALGPYLIGVRPADTPWLGDDGIASIANSGHPARVIFLMRLGTLPFFLLACFVVGLWGSAFGRPVAVLAVALFTLLPTALGDSGLATTDMALGSAVGAAFLAFMFWTKKPTIARSLLLGLCMTLACLSNFSALGYIPTAAVLALTCYVSVRWPVWSGGNLPQAGFLTFAWTLIKRWTGWRDLWELGKRRLVPFAIALSTMGLLIWACYWFSFGSVIIRGYSFRLPAPEFFYGVRDAMHHSRDGHGAFLLGHFSLMGWWYYFPLVLLLKTPIAFLLLLALGAVVCVRERARPVYLMPLAFSFGILLPAMHSHVDIGIRLIEPIYIGMSIIAALGLKQLLQWTRAGRASTIAAGALLVWMIVSVGIQHPDYLAYLNAFAGHKPENILVDSNYDWGQNLKLLAKRLRQLNVQEFSMDTMDGMRLENIQYHEEWYGLPPYNPVDPCVPAPGWNVLSPTIEKSLSRWPGTTDYRGALTPWYEQVAPTERLGPLLLYYIPSDTKLNCLSSTGTDAATAPFNFSGYAQAQPHQNPSNLGSKTTKLSDDFYTIEDQNGTIGMLVGSDGVGLFVADGPSATLTPQVLSAVKQISDAPIQLLVNTHAHGRGRATFQMDGEDVELDPIPGGQIAYFRNSDIIMAGDFYGSMQYPNIDPTTGGNLDGMLEGFGTVLGFAGPHTRIVRGHGPLITRKEIIAHEEMILAVRNQVAQLFLQGKTPDEVLTAHLTSDYDASVPNSQESKTRFVIQLYADARAHRSAW